MAAATWQVGLAAVVLSAVLVLGVAAAPDQAAAWAGAGSAQAGADDADEAAVRVVVRPGDTVWSLARSHLPPGEHLQAYAARVIDRNRVDAGALVPGSVLELPR